jgi:hypothetical protein
MACPSCGNGKWHPGGGGDSTQDPYPQATR